MTEQQKRAVAQMNVALKALDKSGIKICGMDDQLLYATNEVLKDIDRSQRGGDYCEVAMANRFGNTEDTGAFKAACYVDSGGW